MPLWRSQGLIARHSIKIAKEIMLKDFVRGVCSFVVSILGQSLATIWLIAIAIASIRERFVKLAQWEG